MNIKAYFAGPTVFYPNSDSYRKKFKEYSEIFHIDSLYPLDNSFDKDSANLSFMISKSNIEMIQQCDIMIADITEFRGPSMDVGTAFEIGMAVQRGIPVVAYTEGKRKDYRERVEKYMNCSIVDGDYFDSNNHLIENFFLQENLMIAENVIYTSGGYKRAIEIAGLLNSR